MEVDYIGAYTNSSGYANAAKNNILALNSVGVKVNGCPVSFEKESTGHIEKYNSFFNSITTGVLSNKIRIIHVTPNIFQKFVDNYVYNIGYAAWESSKLPDDWVKGCNLVNELWVPSEYNKLCFRNSGVNVPIKVIPHTFNLEDYKLEDDSPLIESIGKDTYTFYSIFQWLERKNPFALLLSYLTEFTKDDDVCLILKVFGNMNEIGTDKDKQAIRGHISHIKKFLYLDNLPRLIMVNNLLDTQQIYQLHNQGDCYVSLTRAEGFGIPFAEAAFFGSSVIYPDYSAMPEFLYGIAGTYPVKTQETPVFGMPWSQYKGDQVWGDPNIMYARKQMRNAFNKGKYHNNIGKQIIVNQLSWETIGNLMKEELRKVNVE